MLPLHTSKYILFVKANRRFAQNHLCYQQNANSIIFIGETINISVLDLLRFLCQQPKQINVRLSIKFFALTLRISFQRVDKLLVKEKMKSESNFLLAELEKS